MRPPPMRLGMFRLDQPLQRVAGHPCDVSHQLHRRPEDVRIDALENVPHAQHSGLVEAGAVGVVDVARAIRESVNEVRADVEHGGNFPEIRSNGGGFFVHGSDLRSLSSDDKSGS
jgi:hypothetical protein